VKAAPYNPLDKVSLARSIELELLTRACNPLTTTYDVVGAGVYVIYYMGNFPAYAPIANDARACIAGPVAQESISHYEIRKHAIPSGSLARPIYVGKAIPKGGRKGGLTKDSSVGIALAERLRQHAVSIDEATNISLTDFYVRHLTVEDIWIPLGENILIETFKPLWNRAIEGFGNKDPGRRRATQYRSPWDVLHPGRKFASKLANSGVTADFLAQRIHDYFAGRPLQKLPKVLAQQQAQLQAEAEASADDVRL
jgi:hypothetical protein